MRCGTLAFPFKGIALPDGALTFTVGMPDLGTKNAPQFRHFSLAENGLQQLWLRPMFFLRSISNYHLPLWSWNCSSNIGVKAHSLVVNS